MIVGHSAREHAIARRLIADGHFVISYMSRKNFGLEKDSHTFYYAEDYSSKDIIQSSLHYGVDLLLPTDEYALYNGVADEAFLSGILCFGHTQRSAFLMEVMRDQVISALCDREYAKRPEGILALTPQEIKALHKVYKNIVVKPIQIRGGVYFIDNNDYDINQISLPAWCEPYIPGIDFSLHYLVNKNSLYFLGFTFDYPFLDEINLVLTGGMGSIVPEAGEISKAFEEILNDCKIMTSAGLLKLKENHQCEINGFISAQFRKVGNQAIFCEIDCKPGNPEIVAILPTIKGDFGKILLDVVKNRMTEIDLNGLASIAISLVPEQYPFATEFKHIISDKLLKNKEVLFGETQKTEFGIRNGRSRTLCIVCSGQDSLQAKNKATALASDINLTSGLRFRDEIVVKIRYDV